MEFTKQYTFSYQQFDDDSFLSPEEYQLLSKARAATAKAYAPYSNFFVGAAALVSNKEIITAANQENASFPVGICAERVLLSSVTSMYDNTAIDAIAISYKRQNGKSDHPITPCGICRQSLAEFENRFNHPIRLILSGMEGSVIVMENTSLLLPLNFGGEELL